MSSEHPARDTGVSAARTCREPTSRSREDEPPFTRAMAVAAGAILLLGAVSVAVLELVLRDGPRPSTPPAFVEPAPEPGHEPAPAPPPPAMPRFDPQASRRLQELPPPPEIRDEPPPTPPKGSWEAVKVAPRPAALGAMGAALGRELNELEPKLSACFDEDTQARYGQQEYTTVRDYARSSDDGTTTVLLLEVETIQGALRIVDAPVEARGGASDGLIACAQRVLRGHVVPVPGTRAGTRHRIQFPLQH